MKQINGFNYIIVECVNEKEKKEAEREGGYDRKRTDPMTNYSYYYYSK